MNEELREEIVALLRNYTTAADGEADLNPIADKILAIIEREVEEADFQSTANMRQTYGY
jgi:tRNA(Ser,Leu) C12 N-acetylase TAN1